MTSNGAERELLIGLLSEALGLAPPEVLANCAETWIGQQRPSLGDELERVGALKPEHRSAIERMVNVLVEAHGGAAAALGAVGGSARLRQAFDGRVAFETGTEPTIAPKSRPPVDEATTVTPETAGRYLSSDRGGDELGRGGIGRVLAAVDDHLGREVAIKEIQLRHREGSGSDSAAILGRFLREARVTAQLEHPNIIPVYELGQRKSGDYYYAMKLVRGSSLAKALESATSLEERLALLPHFVDLCQAIAYAHSRGVVHRDIKPQNVMVGEFGETLVLDWGLAKVRGKSDIVSAELERGLNLKDSVLETMPGVPHGTPAYMSPEQCQGDIGAIDERSDVWALGVVLYQILTGKLPFTSPNAMSLLVSITRDPLPSIRSVCAEAPLELAAVSERALTRDKAGRYRSAKELAEEVQAYQSGGRVDAYRYGSLELLKRFLAAHRAEVVVAVVALVVLMGMGVAAYVQVLGERDRAFRAEAEGKKSIADALGEHARSSALELDFTSAEIYSTEALTYGPQAFARALDVASSALASHARLADRHLERVPRRSRIGGWPTVRLRGRARGLDLGRRLRAGGSDLAHRIGIHRGLRILLGR